MVFIILTYASMPAVPQNPPPSSGPSTPSRRDSVDVVERLSPEEAEEGRLNDAYQALAQLQRRGQCSADLILRYEAEVISVAEKSAFNVPKNKFLFLASRDVATCYLAQEKFAEAEPVLERAIQVAPIWPGVEDSAYPAAFLQIATAQMGQQHWPAAEQSLLKSITLFDARIAAEAKKAPEQRSRLSINYHGPRSQSYALLAVVYLREGLVREALDTAEKAYDEVTKFEVTQRYRKDVEDIGKAIANASGDPTAQNTWSRRGPSN